MNMKQMIKINLTPLSTTWPSTKKTTHPNSPELDFVSRAVSTRKASNLKDLKIFFKKH